MKKAYEAPTAEVVKFEYRDQVVVASGCEHTSGRIGTVESGCTNPETTGRTN